MFNNRFKGFTKYELAIMNKALLKSIANGIIPADDEIVLLHKELAEEIMSRNLDPEPAAGQEGGDREYGMSRMWI